MKKHFLFYCLISISLLSTTFAQWEKVKSPVGTTVQCMAVKDGLIFAGTSGIYVSSNNGKSWMEKSNGLTELHIRSINVWDDKLLAFSSNKIFFSSNNGDNWNQINTPSDFRSIALNGNNIYAANYISILKSTDKGASWKVLFDYNKNFYTVWALFVIDSTLIVSTERGILTSNEDGSNWKISGVSNDVNNFCKSGEKLVACSRNSGIYVSTDKGSSWIQRNNGIPETITSFNYVYAADSIFLAGTEYGAFRSFDEGQNWIQINNGLTQPVYSFAVNGNNLFAGNRLGISLSTNNGNSWEYVNTGLSTSKIYTLAFSDNDLFAGTQLSGLFRSSDLGENWISVNNGLSSYGISALAIKGNNIYAGVGSYYDNPAGLFISTDQGNSWVNSSSGIYKGQSVEKIIISGEKIYAITVETGFIDYGYIYVSSDNGINWTLIKSSSPIISFLPYNNYLFFGDYDGTGKRMNIDSLKWQNLSTWMDKIWSFTSINEKIFAGSFEGFFLSSNNGDSWTRISDYCSEILLANNSNLIGGGTYTGLSTSSDYGVTWVNQNEGLTSLNMNSLIIEGNYLYAGIGSNIWRRKLQDFVSTVKNDDQLPNTFTLYQNFPNPFNNSTIISYSLPVKEFVSLKVYNLLGKEISVLVNEEKPEGKYTANFSSSDLPSGIYFYTIRAGSFIETKKLIILK